MSQAKSKSGSGGLGTVLTVILASTYCMGLHYWTAEWFGRALFESRIEPNDQSYPN